MIHDFLTILYIPHSPKMMWGLASVAPTDTISLTRSGVCYRTLQKTVAKQICHITEKQNMELILNYKQDISLKDQVKVGHQTTSSKP
jgi:hypothetical protein